MIKLVNLVSLIAAPIMVSHENLGVVGWLVVLAMLAAWIWAFAQSQKHVDLTKDPEIVVPAIGK
jgi:hypothetical protein